MTYNRIKLEVKDRVALVGFGLNSKKSMTTLDQETLEEFDRLVKELKSIADKRDIDGVIFHSLIPGVFLAGADIDLISTLKSESEAQKGAEVGQVIYSQIEDLAVPTVACVDGVCLGGGLEMALSCTNIIASTSPKTMLGLPEVKLGFIPGFGGTYRLPRKVGLPTSLDMILTGRTLNSRKAKRVGLIAAAFPPERLIVQAPNFFKAQKKAKSAKEKLEEALTGNLVAKKLIFQKARESVLQKTKGVYHAPLKILDVMENNLGKNRNSYLKAESQAFGELCVGVQSQNLQHIFFLNESAKKFPGAKNDGEGKQRTLKRGAVLGAGTMGGGIAWLMAQQKMFPLMKDITPEALELGLKQSSANFSQMVKRRKMTHDEFEKKQRSIRPTINFEGFNSVDLVIEAIVENMEIKKSVLKELESHLPKDAIITSNTSSLSVQEMGSDLADSSRFAGLHFFNPVNRMPLVEIITHDKVSDETVEALYRWVVKAKKVPVVVGDGPGFLVNRILMPFLNEAAYLLNEGVSIEEVDEAATNFGMPMGPCRLMDEVGIDVAIKVADIMFKGLGARMTPADLSGKMMEQGLLGRKNSKGFYLYDSKGKEGGVNQTCASLLPKRSHNLDEREIQLRLFLPMINEAAAILDDKIVSDAGKVDLGLIMGLGFPPFRGGLLRYADSEGLPQILKEIKRLAGSADAERYKPADYLVKLVEEGRQFYQS
jgi:3-hydroxyacyl-CoA dehydrogenase / enoyl-CoA hydratase / 3-hydroxybutyryl-CoA epimerase